MVWMIGLSALAPTGNNTMAHSRLAMKAARCLGLRFVSVGNMSFMNYSPRARMMSRAGPSLVDLPAAVLQLGPACLSRRDVQALVRLRIDDPTAGESVRLPGTDCRVVNQAAAILCG